MRRCLLLIVAAWIPGLVFADGHPVTMWLAEGASNRVYILGSVHLLRRQDHPLPAVMEAAYADAESLIMELDMDDLDAAALQASTNRLGVIHDDRTLKDFLGDARYNEAAAAAREMEIPFEMLDKAEPWFAAITIEQLALTRIGFNPLYGIELHLTMKATQDGKEVTGLETIDEQLAMLDGLSIEAQNDLLLQTLAEGGNIEAFMDDMIRAWRVGNVDYLETNMLDDMAKYPELFDAIVVNRNQRWVSAIEALLDDEDDYLIVVGALHLVGDVGVPALLEKRGVKIGQLHESF